MIYLNLIYFIKGMFDCNRVEELAIVKYEGAPDDEPSEALPETDAGHHGKDIVVNAVASEEEVNIVELNSAGI